MKISKIIFSFFCFCSLQVSALAPFNAYVSHTEGRGIGYNQGYTSFGLFITPQTQNQWQYFLDGRYHVFNDGEPAANAGAGLRYLDYQRQKVYGANLYYDYRRVHHEKFQQIGLGFEILGKCYDIRVNGYIPVGRNHVDFGHTLFIYPGNSFALCKKREKVMAGFDAEVGMPLLNRCNPCNIFQAYGAAGLYYFTPRIYSRCGHDTWGVKARVQAKMWNFIELEGRTTYDREFGWRGEGVIGITFPLGERCYDPCNACCDYLRVIANQPVQRQEIIVISKPHCEWNTNFIEKSCDDDSSSSSHLIVDSSDSSSSESFESPSSETIESSSSSSEIIDSPSSETIESSSSSEIIESSSSPEIFENSSSSSEIIESSSSSEIIESSSSSEIIESSSSSEIIESSSSSSSLPPPPSPSSEDDSSSDSEPPESSW